ncbi:MAG: SDR family NAD(P)-dependent oxidoreductase [Rhizobacter sp.]
MSSSRLAVIAGAGGVLGRALVVEFTAAGYTVAALRRDAASVDAPAHGFSCNLSDAADAQRAMASVIGELGPVTALIYNAAHLVTAPFAELTPADFEAAWRASVPGAVACAQAVLPGMLQQGHGALLFSGATASVRGGARFAAFASAKFALRGLAQSLAREYHAHGVHVGHVVLDGVLAGSPAAQRFGVGDARALAPAEVASTYRWLAEQAPQAWAHEIDLRPHTENF